MQNNEGVPERLRDLIESTRLILKTSLQPLSENEAICIFLGIMFKWGGPASTVIKIDEVQDIWRMFVCVNSWRTDFINLQFSSFVSQMLQWLQECRDSPMLKYMQSIEAPQEYRRKGVKLYQKGGFRCLQFNKDVYKRLYMHMLSQSKEPFILSPEERNDVEHSHPTSTNDKQRIQLKSVIAPKDAAPSTSFDTVTRSSTDNIHTFTNNYKHRGDGRGYHRNNYYDSNDYQREQFKGRNHQHQQNGGRRAQRGTQRKKIYEVDSYVPEKRKPSVSETPPKIITFIPTHEPQQEEQDTPKKAKRDSDVDLPNPRFNRPEVEEDHDVDSV